jgi:hypothetical protein
MSRPKREGDRAVSDNWYRREHFAAEKLYYVKVKLDQYRKRESDEDTREALGRRSATEFLRERQ